MRVYFNEKCEECGSTNVITLRDASGEQYEHCNDCGHNSKE